MKDKSGIWRKVDGGKSFFFYGLRSHFVFSCLQEEGGNCYAWCKRGRFIWSLLPLGSIKDVWLSVRVSQVLSGFWLRFVCGCPTLIFIFIFIVSYLKELKLASQLNLSAKEVSHQLLTLVLSSSLDASCAMGMDVLACGLLHVLHSNQVLATMSAFHHAYLFLLCWKNYGLGYR